MSMADTREAFGIVLRISPDDDPELTCFACSFKNCGYSFSFRMPGRLVMVGIHKDCAELVGKRTTP